MDTIGDEICSFGDYQGDSSIVLCVGGYIIEDAIVVVAVS